MTRKPFIIALTTTATAALAFLVFRHAIVQVHGGRKSPTPTARRLEPPGRCRLSRQPRSLVAVVGPRAKRSRHPVRLLPHPGHLRHGPPGAARRTTKPGPRPRSRPCWRSIQKRVRMLERGEALLQRCRLRRRQRVESRDAESVLNAVILASYDAAPGPSRVKPPALAFDNAWALQSKTGPDAGAWVWQNFDYASVGIEGVAIPLGRADGVSLWQKPPNTTAATPQLPRNLTALLALSPDSLRRAVLAEQNRRAPGRGTRIPVCSQTHSEAHSSDSSTPCNVLTAAGA